MNSICFIYYSLHENLIEHLSAEISLQTVTCSKTSLEWLKTSFLYVRIPKNPQHYKLGVFLLNQTTDEKLNSLLLIDLEKLVNHEIILRDKNSNLSSTIYGLVMAKYYLTFETIVKISEMKQKCTLLSILNALCSMNEFNMIKFHQDKKILTNLKKDNTLRFPFSKNVTRLDEKINVLIQVI